MSDPFLGEIRLTGFNFAPQGWAMCDGQILAISQNTALFSLLGTNYGGNGTSTFGLPDLRSRVAIHQGQGLGLSNYNLGETGGSEGVELSTAQMPQHNHSMMVDGSPNSATSANPSGSFLANSASRGATGSIVYGPGTDSSAMKSTAISQAGGSQPHANIQPFQVLNFIIALQGIFPSRS